MSVSEAMEGEVRSRSHLRDKSLGQFAPVGQLLLREPALQPQPLDFRSDFHMRASLWESASAFTNTKLRNRQY